jgi:site-specific recombinase XerD
VKQNTVVINAKELFNGGQEVQLGQAVQAFLRLEMVGKSPQTRHWYADRLERMAEALGAERSLASVMEIDLEDWLASLAGRRERYGQSSTRPKEDGGLSPYTLNGYITAVRRWAKWLLKRGVATADLSANLCKVRLPKVGKKGVSDRDAQGILEAARSSPRDYAIVHFLLATGGRLGGVAHLTLGDLALDSPDPLLRQRATVREKGSKERTVFLGSEAQAALSAWLKVRPACRCQRVFLQAKRDKTGEYRGLRENGIYAAIKRLAVKAGVQGPASPHQFRHMFGRKMAESGMNLGLLSQVMGHTSPQVTVMHYGQFAVEDLQSAYNRAQKRRERDFNAGDSESPDSDAQGT